MNPKRVAKEILAKYEVPIASAQRGRGWTNLTWLTDEYVIRVASTLGPADLLREERLVKVLPIEVGYPSIIDSGTWHDHEWVLTRRIHGENLEEVWSSQNSHAQTRAIEQMWQRVRHVHRLNVAAATRHVRACSPFFPENPTAVKESLNRLVSAGELTVAQIKGLDRALARFWEALPGAPRALNHGDLCLPNTLRHNNQVVGLLDFEFAVIGPIAIDLNEVVKLAFAPGDSAELAPSREVVGQIAETALPSAGGPDVLVGYSIMLEIWLLGQQLAAGEDRDENERAACREKLIAFSQGNGGYFAPLLKSL